jgi:pimeloyl-ACP methyl ester carboxylesterase
MAVESARNGSVELVYETVGPPGGEPLLLVMGLDSPMRWWPDGFCFELADRGFTVVRFDNRDTGRSTRTVGRLCGGTSWATAAY